jgi:hypothetical protein
MRAKSSKAIDLLLACLLSLIPTVAEADTVERVRNSHSVALGYVPDFAPLGTQVAGKASGYVIDLCQMRSLRVVATLVPVQDTGVGLQRVAEGNADFFAERTMLKHELADKYATGKLVLLDRIVEYSTTSMMVDRNHENFRLLIDRALSKCTERVRLSRHTINT